MGTSNGHWEGDTLVVDVSSLNGNSWFDRSGNFQTENTHVVERFTLGDADHIDYEATIDDNTIYTRPWKIATVFYRRREKNAQLNEFKCVEYAEATDLRGPEEEVAGGTRRREGESHEIPTPCTHGLVGDFCADRRVRHRTNRQSCFRGES